MRILVVDDSIVFRSGIKKVIESTNLDVDSVKAVSNGKIALATLKLESFDLLIVDLEMPEMDGITTVQEVRKTDRITPIIIFSAHSQAGAKKTIEALNAGASDFVTKNVQATSMEEGMKMIEQELIPKIQALTEKRAASRPKAPKTPTQFAIAPKDLRPELICIGSSTGGPDALKTVFKELNKTINVPILVVQHMPPMFTAQLAELLDKISPISVCEAKDGMEIERGKAYIAPGDYHMEIVVNEEGRFIRLNQNQKECFVRPAVNVTLRSIAHQVKGVCLVCIMTGMGDDGTQGVKDLQLKNPHVIVQDEASAAVWSMPKGIVDAGLHQNVVELDDIGRYINKSLGL